MKPLIGRVLGALMIFALIFGAIHGTGEGGRSAPTSSRAPVKPDSSGSLPFGSPPALESSAPLDGNSLAAPVAGPPGAKREAAHETLETYAFRGDIENFRSLNKKVFLTDDEKRAKRALLENGEFLKSLTHLLTVGAGESTEMKQAQDVALDVLFESLRTDAGSPVAEVLLEIVGDTQIESETIDMVTKRDLAGVKAEVLYYWSSLDPASSGRIEQSLPGPVSRRIWENVVSAQKNNLEESSLEASRYPSSVDEL